MRTKFYLAPKSYVIKKGCYYIFLELSVRLRGIQDYYFIAENIVLKYSDKEISERFQKKESTKKSLIDNDTKVQFFIIPK